MVAEKTKATREISTRRRESILVGHTWKYALSTAEIIGAAYFDTAKNPTEQARRFLSRLVTEGYLAARRAFSHDVPKVAAPVFSWSPGATGPNVEALAYQLVCRWDTSPKPVTVYYATKKATNAVGGRRVRPNTTQASHDLLSTVVYLAVEKSAPEDAKNWQREDLYKHRLGPSEKLGDARLVSDGRDYRLIETLGKYSADHLAEIHPYCLDHELSYELW